MKIKLRALNDETFIILLYHGIDSGEEYYSRLSNFEKEYIITYNQIIRHLNLYKKMNLNAVSLEECLKNIRDKRAMHNTLILTFDDGAESCYSTIAPVLEEYGYRGNFFIVVNWINRPGYMTAGQILELKQRGHGIYSHSMTHPFFSKISDEQITYELEVSKKILEEILGGGVSCFSLPTGEYDRRFESLLASSGYSCVCLSKEGYNSVTQDVTTPHFLYRFSVRRYSSLKGLEFIIKKRDITRIFLKIKVAIFSGIKRFVGKNHYESLRNNVINNLIRMHR